MSETEEVVQKLSSNEIKDETRENAKERQRKSRKIKKQSK